ncbi:MAG: hypothetical protein WCI39_03785 [Gallionellaceae bacterium]
MSSDIASASSQDRRKSRETKNNHAWGIFLAIVATITIGGYFVVHDQTLYTPGDKLFDLGFNLGLAGGLMMMTLLLYPLRKRIKLFHGLGLLPTWFKWHMVLGILGPLTIIFHSTYHVYIPYFHPVGSVNAAVAILCMLLVSGSGTFGRFFYTKIHHGLYGRQATVNEIKASLEQSGDVKSTFNFAPEIEKKMADFKTYAEANSQSGKLGLVQFAAIGYRAHQLKQALVKQLHVVMHDQAREKNFTASQNNSLEKMYAEYSELIVSFVNAVRDAAQFHTYERLFSYWHIFHIPLVYMMVFATFYHVYWALAVLM